MEITSVIIKPRLTEKTQIMRTMKDPVMSFVVNAKANKHQVANAFKALFGVSPESVNIINRKKSPARYTRYSRYNYKRGFKIALVKVKGQDFENLKDVAIKEAKGEEDKVEEVKVEE